MTTVQTFSQGPLLKVQIELKEGFLYKTHLSPCPSFTCEIFGSIDAKGKKELFSWLESYSRGIEPKVELPLVWKGLSAFQQKVLEKMKKVSFGQMSTYQGLAKAAGNGQAARAVGNVCRGNPFPLFIPCHRIIKTDGTLGGFAYGPQIKRALLRFEGSLT